MDLIKFCESACPGVYMIDKYVNSDGSNYIVISKIEKREETRVCVIGLRKGEWARIFIEQSFKPACTMAYTGTTSAYFLSPLFIGKLKPLIRDFSFSTYQMKIGDQKSHYTALEKKEFVACFDNGLFILDVILDIIYDYYTKI